MDAEPPCEILFEDPHLIVVNKPAPLPTQAAAGIGSLEELIKDYIKLKYRKPAGVYLAVPHRLDRPVSGAICFVRNSKAAARIQAQFEGRTVEKIYWALVAGRIDPPAGQWQDTMRKVPDEPRAERCPADAPGAKLAELHYRTLCELPNDSLLELKPTTGRMHQLRAQAGWRGHAVLGDEQYGSTLPFGPPGELLRDRAIALHARQLTLDHPFGKGRLTFTAGLPAYWPAVG
jgi:23S rRNA pseudouridine1911/1915/1917 synthase